MRDYTSVLVWGLFVLSVAVLGVAYGMAANQWGWFPRSFAERAWEQAAAYVEFSHLYPQTYDREGARIVNAEQVHPGATLITSMWRTQGEWEPRVRLVDREGRVFHEWRIDDSLFSKRNYVHGTYLFPNGDVVVNVEYVGTVRLGACGEVLWRLPERTHHSIARAEDGSFWIPAKAKAKTDGYPGIERPVVSENILHVTEEGKILEEISVLDVLYENDLERHIFKVHGSSPRGDILHLNDVEPLKSAMSDEYLPFENGDLLVSLRNLHLVFVFDPETHEVKWHGSHPFFRQHDPDFIGEGWIGVLDNNPDGTKRGTVLGGSRIVAVQPSSDSVRTMFPIQSSTSFYTSAGGKWQKLENGNMLLTEAQSGRIVEVAPDGSIVWEWIKEPYESKVAEVLEGTRYNVPTDTASWSCASNSGSRFSNRTFYRRSNERVIIE